MSEQVKVTLIGGAFLVIASFAFGGVYSITPVSHGDRIGSVQVLNRLTGTTWTCYVGGCEKNEWQ